MVMESVLVSWTEMEKEMERGMVSATRMEIGNHMGLRLGWEMKMASGVVSPSGIMIWMLKKMKLRLAMETDLMLVMAMW